METTPEDTTPMTLMTLEEVLVSELENFEEPERLKIRRDLEDSEVDTSEIELQLSRLKNKYLPPLSNIIAKPLHSAIRKHLAPTPEPFSRKGFSLKALMLFAFVMLGFLIRGCFSAPSVNSTSVNSNLAAKQVALIAELRKEIEELREKPTIVANDAQTKALLASKERTILWQVKQLEVWSALRDEMELSYTLRGEEQKASHFKIGQLSIIIGWFKLPVGVDLERVDAELQRYRTQPDWRITPLDNPLNKRMDSIPQNLKAPPVHSSTNFPGRT